MFQDDTPNADSPANDTAVSGSVTELERDQIPPNDITFDCPHCGKNHSIDPRGAGLVINCTECGEPLTVPIPEGLEIDDIDATIEELSTQLVNARQRLHRADERIVTLEAKVLALVDLERKLKERDEEDEVFFDILRTKLATLATAQTNAATLTREIIQMISTEE